MRIIKGYPPNYRDIVNVFGEAAVARACFTWGSTIWCPSWNGRPFSHHLIVHETTHCCQQVEAGGSSQWWERYLHEPEFRLAQEVEAYRAQYRVMNRAERRKDLERCLRDLSGPMYGNLVTYDQARELVCGS